MRKLEDRADLRRLLGRAARCGNDSSAPTRGGSIKPESGPAIRVRCVTMASSQATAASCAFRKLLATHRAARPHFFELHRCHFAASYHSVPRFEAFPWVARQNRASNRTALSIADAYINRQLMIVNLALNFVLWRIHLRMLAAGAHRSQTRHGDATPRALNPKCCGAPFLVQATTKRFDTLARRYDPARGYAGKWVMTE
jgi:hypothetical protein